MVGHHHLVTRRSGLLLGRGAVAPRRGGSPARVQDGARMLRLYSDGAATSPYGAGARALVLLHSCGAVPDRYKPGHGETAASGLGEVGSVLQGATVHR
ncbi:hypothetical protein SAMN02927895_05290 [Belnapia rosea]|nr:hypothetical protein SAMN02927895_05290 [Belnapia rosea]